MEYFKYDYKNVDTIFNFTNYDSFITTRTTYKYYLFDLALLQHDNKTDMINRHKAKFQINLQKTLFIIPYLVIFSTLFYYHKRNFFLLKIRQKEFQIVSSLFMFLISVRIIQKGILKHEGDKILIPIAKNKDHSI